MFGEVSGHTINLQKSAILSTKQFKLSTEYIKYLGIKIIKRPRDLFKSNFTEKLDKFKDNIEKWRTLPLSLIGRVNAVIRVSLPRFLYIFQNVFQNH